MHLFKEVSPEALTDSPTLDTHYHTGTSLSSLLCGMSCFGDPMSHSSETSSSRFLRRGMWEVQLIEILNI